LMSCQRFLRANLCDSEVQVADFEADSEEFRLQTVISIFSLDIPKPPNIELTDC
jgi:hypothetical protein